MGTGWGAKKAREIGKSFEGIVDMYAKYQGVLVHKCTQQVFRHGRCIRIKAPYDVSMLCQGITVYCDIKTFDADKLTWSLIDQDQLANLDACDRFGATAGYLIWFRKSDVVCFARASQMMAMNKGDSLHGREMVILGKIDSFSLTRLFSLHWER